MQQASIILQVEESMTHLRHFYDKQYIHTCCAPLREFYDYDIITNPDHHEEMKKLTAEIKVLYSLHSCSINKYTKWSCDFIDSNKQHTKLEMKTFFSFFAN